MSCQKIKHKRLICVQTIIDVKIYLDMVRVITRSQKVDVLNISKISL